MLVIKEEKDREESRGTDRAERKEPVERLELRAKRRSSMALERTRR